MIEIEKTLVSDTLFERRFVCNLKACKGACCVEGDAGAPLEKEETEFLAENFEKIKPYLREEGIRAIEDQGTHVIDREGDEVTPLVDGKECAFTVFETNGTAKCGIEIANRAGAIDFVKPISCHLYPIRLSKVGKYEALNYSKWSICEPACTLGESLNVKVFRFLKEPIIRRYGADYFGHLEEVDRVLDSQ